MELGSSGGDNGGGGGSSRWNPTKEQISLLESLYRQGVRTPSADQIQQITARLRAYGQIEGKNVFYWFQNHKARQRQKQKQESMAYFNRLLQKTTHFFHRPPCSNVACSSYYLQHADSGPYTQSPSPIPIAKVPLSAYRSRKSTACPRPIPLSKQPPVPGAPRELCGLSLSPGENSDAYFNSGGQRTLPLFPLQPTRDVQGNSEVPGLASVSEWNSDSTPPSSSGNSRNHLVYDENRRPFFDFLSGSKGSFEA